MRILATGDAGFFGSNIIDAYVKEGHEVSVVDDLSSGITKNVNPKATFFKYANVCGPRQNPYGEKPVWLRSSQTKC